MVEFTPAHLIKVISKVKLLSTSLLALSLSLFIVELYSITQPIEYLYTFNVSMDLKGVFAKCKSGLIRTVTKI